MGTAPKKALALLCAAFSATSIQAQTVERTSTETSSSYISAMPYGVVQDRDRAIWDDNGVGARFLFGKALSKGWHWEGQLGFNNLETGIGGYTDYYQYHLGLDYSYRFGDQKGFTPFILLGLGAVHDDIYPLGANRPDEDETNLFANAGFGFVSGVIGDSGVKVRTEARYIHSEFADGFDDWHLGIGFEVPLGRTVTKTIIKEKVKEVEVVKEVTAPAADSDQDGVVDGVDECPNTLPGAKVDGKGCAIKEQTIQLEGIFFESGSDQLKPSSVQNLQKIAAFLQEQADLRVEIAGHTDSSGAAEYNQRLSQARADSVKFFLIRQGVDPSRLYARGYGEDQPIADNANPAGRAMNRRVEFRIQR